MIYKGEDKVLSITIVDSSGTIQSIDAMTDLIVSLYHDRMRTALIEYRKVAISGFTTLLRVSATEYTAIIPKSVTDTFQISNLMIEIEIQEADARFPANIRRTKGKGTITQVANSMIDE
jgi:hypothetical protein